MRLVNPLRVVVMGTGPFAVPMFHTLLKSSHEIVAVVTRPDRVAPGRRPPPNPMREAAVAAGIRVLDPENVNAPESVALLRELAADLFVVCDYGQILSREVLSIPRLGGINLHGSLLPRHRGAAPVQWTILSGDAVAGVSVIHMTPALDAGRVIARETTPVGPAETSAELEPRLARLGAPLVPEAIRQLASASDFGSVGVAQDPALVTRAPRLSKADSIVDWTAPADVIERRRRALEPWPRTTTFLEKSTGERLRLVLEEVAVAEACDRSGPPGTVLAADTAGIAVACGGGTVLRIRQLVPEGRRSMTAAEFLRGTLVVPGMQFCGADGR